MLHFSVLSLSLCSLCPMRRSQWLPGYPGEFLLKQLQAERRGGGLGTGHMRQKAQLTLHSVLLSLSCLLGFCLMLTDTHSRHNPLFHNHNQAFISPFSGALKEHRQMESVVHSPETFWKPHINKRSPGMLSGIFCLSHAVMTE